MITPLYVFDLDETLLDGDSTMIWNEFLIEKGIVKDPNFLQEDKRLMDLYSQGSLSMEEYLEFAMAPLSSKSKDDVARLVEECVKSKVLGRIFPQALELIQTLKKHGHPIIIVSATVAFIVDCVAQKLDIPNAIGIELVEESGKYTAKIAGTPSYQQGKVVRLQEWMDSQNQSFNQLHFYTDSINDLPMCEFADRAYLVNPCERIAPYAEPNQWQVLNWGRLAC
ncbi:HAD family hydrolase [Vibrio gallaecicus]|uniref:HAD family hydrolase n=1 Tax=Vibrio gallaecicus TaxID=552386 RepID=UPI0010C9B2A6|nr:HAD family hydrolase [Vibrio gallaecicus]MDN3616555.1 HAD family hydrolase [Vibrio gallaecicus]